MVCALRDRRAVARARGWSRAQGIVIDWQPPSRDPRGEFRLIYEFRVGTRVFRGARICAGGEDRRGPRAWARCRAYLDHRLVLVNYDPADPHRACVELTSDREGIALSAGLLFSLLGLLVLL